MATSLDINDAMTARIQRLAEARQQSPVAIMQAAIEQYLEREEERQSFIQEALESWEEYQRTGLHITGEELHAWLATWGTEAEAEAPPCHT